MKTDKKILITGCRGMLGTDLMKSLTNAKGIDIEDADITNRDNIISIIRDIKPDLVIHTAAFTDVDGAETNPERAYDINAIGTMNIALSCKETKSILLFISTDYIFDGRKKKPYTETDIPNPLNVYGRTKLIAEIFISDLLENYFIVRTAWLYGRAGKNFVDTIISLSKEKEELEVVADQRGSPTSTIELIKSILKLINTEEFGIYNITCSGSCTWFEFAQKIVELKKLSCKIMPTDSFHYKRPARRPQNSVLDNSKIIKTINYKPLNWESALKEYLDAF